MSALALLLVQIAVVLVAARAVGGLFRALGQPQVVGEMAAGILLGPSLLGWLAPGASAALFPVESLASFGAVSKVGLVVYMFLVGLEFDPKLMRGKSSVAVLTSHASIATPFFLGSVLALFLYPRLSDESVEFTGFALFLGAAMSVTAFPVLARILAERNLLRSKVGAITIACAAVDDITAWAILAVVIAIVRTSAAHTPLWVTLAGSAVYVVLMLFVVRRLLEWLERRHEVRGRVDQLTMSLLFFGLLVSAWVTEWLGIHALFGAFCFGAVLPKGRLFVHQINEKLEDITVLLLLPLFFASAGLRTEIGLVQGAEMWGFFGLIMLVAVAGKFGGSTIAARIMGLTWRESGAIGILMNTRGLMELVILTIGLDLGVISPALFAMMVMMALATTCMTTPILQRLYPPSLLREDDVGPVDDESRILIPVSLPSAGPGLLRVARSLISSDEASHRIYPVHFRSTAGGHFPHLASEDLPRDEDALRPLLDAAHASGIHVRPMVFAAQRPAREIVDLAQVKGAQWIVMGWHKPVVREVPGARHVPVVGPIVDRAVRQAADQRVLGGTVHEVLDAASCHVAVFVERDPGPWKRILAAHHVGGSDRRAIETALDMARFDPEARLTLLHVGPEGSPEPPVIDVEPALRDRVTIHHETTDDPVSSLVEHARDCDLVIVGVFGAWELGQHGAIFAERHERLASETRASLLLVRSSPTRHSGGHA